MTDHIHEAADNLRGLILRHMHVPAPQAAGYLRDPSECSAHSDIFARHPLDPTGAGGKLALFVVEALSLILRRVELSGEQIARLNSILDQIGSRINNISADLAGVIDHVTAAADPATDDTVDLNLLQDRLSGILDRLNTIDQAVTNSGSPAANPQPQAGATTPAPETGSTTGGDTGGSSTETPASTTSSEPTSTSTDSTSTAAGDGTELAPGA